MIKRQIRSFANGARVAALLFFFLPWVTVSCSSMPGDTELTQVLTVSEKSGSGAATGFSLATGTAVISIPPALNRAQPAAPGPRPAVLAAILLILLGLAAGFALGGKRAALAAAAATAAAIGLLGYAILFEVRLLTRDWLLAWAGSEFPAQESLRDPGRMLEVIQVRPQIGFWLTIAALAAAIALDLFALKRARGAPPPS
ncbi:MAG TPA: hypothetical protein VEX35_01675 [Allosphingosinicella sp.]|nr:hypothetical protein [Allosphingosinicella sp.]